MFCKISNFLSVLFLYAFLFSALGCGKDDDSGSGGSDQIIPGQGIAEIKIGDTGQAVFDAFGTTADSWSGFGGSYTHFLIYLGKGLTFYLEPNDSETLDLTKKVARIVIETPFSGKTDKGIGIGSSMADVKAAYGEPDSETTLFGVTEHTYNIGLVIEYDDQGNDTVAYITIE